jgi:hypothetical protein
MIRQTTGHLKIEKVYEDHSEVVFDDHNIIVSGMGVGLGALFAGTGSTSILDYQLRYARLGTSGMPEAEETYTLSSALVEANYGGQLIVLDRDLLENGATIADQSCITIPHTSISKVDKTSVRYRIIIDEAACVGQALTEIGLYMKNYTGAVDDNPILVAYRTFSSIPKENDFSLIFTWTITY